MKRPGNQNPLPPPPPPPPPDEPPLNPEPLELRGEDAMVEPARPEKSASRLENWVALNEANPPGEPTYQVGGVV